MLPGVMKVDLSRHLQAMRVQHQSDLATGAGWVELPTALARKYRNAGREWVWQWVFPATRVYRDRVTGELRRHHLHESVLQRAFKHAVRQAGMVKRASPMSCATRSRRTCSRTATTFEPSRNYWGIAT